VQCFYSFADIHSLTHSLTHSLLLVKKKIEIKKNGSLSFHRECYETLKCAKFCVEFRNCESSGFAEELTNHSNWLPGPAVSWSTGCPPHCMSLNLQLRTVTLSSWTARSTKTQNITEKDSLAYISEYVGNWVAVKLSKLKVHRLSVVALTFET